MPPEQPVADSVSTNEPLKNELNGSVKREPSPANQGHSEAKVKEEVTEATVDSEPQQTNGTKRQRTVASPSLVVVPHKKPELFYSPLKTGVVYDVRMRYHAKIFTSYFEYIDPHPEDPRRIYRIYKKLAEAGLIQDIALSGSEDIGPLMVKIPAREATTAEILEVHTQEHLDYIALTEAMTRDQLLEETEKGDSIYVNNDLYLLAKLSCGGLIEACKAVIEGHVKNSLAIVRPPGHHAEPDTPGGFCLFSNVAVAAKNMLKSYPDSCRRIVVLDWDIHHGNGTQKAFYNNRDVLYISLHRFENGKFYPGTKFGGADKVGEGKGEGYSVNIPWQNAGVGDADYVYAFQKIVIPIICEFDPDLIIVSAGFDAADGDIIGQCHVTPAGYGQFTHMLKAIAKGKLTVILEGGYNLDSISNSALGVAKVLVGEPPENTVSTQPSFEAIETVNEVMKIQSKYWKCMRPGIASHIFDDFYELPEEQTLSFAELLRGHQAKYLLTRYSFINLPIFYNSDEQQLSFTLDVPSHVNEIVFASPEVYSSTSIIISIHYPPEVWASVNPINGSIDCTSSVIKQHPISKFMDKVKTELKKEGSTEKVGYIDVNIPSYLEASAHGVKSATGAVKSSTYNSTIFGQELLLWIWDNYVTYFSSLKKIVFIGYGDAYQSIVHLFAKRPSQKIKELVQGTVVFASRSNLKALVPVMDESMVDWYYQNSMVFTSCMNPCWVGTGKGDSEEVGKQPRRKFGRVIKAAADSLWDVTNEKFDESVEFILDSIADSLESE
ncbi:hypothetical protein METBISCDRAFT_11348 [Metschnikowia bicuspidata]|uniref:Histone deacetylase n=1 Tax=Metschnikowia bicuspidata TaxID=27322 RepID=A0A4P9ZKD3_9ASCO|nr:hypothetical protein METBISCDRAFT_11348 [Metschnikowia bicuspidata]